MRADNIRKWAGRSYLFLLLLLPNIYAVFRASDLSGSPVKCAAYMAVVLFGLLLPALLLRARAYFILLGCLCLFCAPVEIASLYLNKGAATVTFLGFVYATNPGEIMGVLGAVWPLVPVLIGLWIAYFVVAARQPDEWLVPRRLGVWCAGVGLPVLLIAGLAFLAHHVRTTRSVQDTREVAQLTKELLLMKFNKIFPYDFYLNTHSIIRGRREARRAQEKLADFRFGVTRQDEQPVTIVLVIGEAARSENFALNGYERPTNPRLSARANVVSYPHLYSQAGTTEQSVPLMLSRATVDDPERFFAEKTLPEAFQETGFATLWLTNKSRNLMMERVVQTTDYRYQTSKDLSAINNFDEYLLVPYGQQLQARRDSSAFVVVHTMGSHWRYDVRYTPEFELFTPCVNGDFQMNMIKPSNRELLLNAYDNSILYTDYFLDSLIALTDATDMPALMVFMSDHGENLYDDDRELVLHGNYVTSRWLFQVPFIVWYSDEYAALYPDKVEQLRSHVATRDNSSVLFSSLLDAAGIAAVTPEGDSIYSLSRSIFSADYRTPESLRVLTAEGMVVVMDE